MGKPILIVIITMLSLSVIFASAVKNMPTKITQPDGQTINCFVTGDEYHHWLHDKDGYTIIKDKTSGNYVWAMKDGDNLIASKYVVGKTDPNTLGVEKWLNISSQKILKKRMEEIQHTTSINDTRIQCPTIGQVNNLVIFIRFSDQSEFADDYQFYDSIFNDSSSTARSLYNYYKEVSYNQLFIRSSNFQTSANNTIVSYQDSKPRSYYCELSQTNPDGFSDSEAYERERELLKNTLQSVSSQIPTNLNIDSNNDGAVDNICFIIKGGETEWASLLWPHASSMLGSDEINGKKVYQYNVNLETFATFPIDLGTLAHEMFHSMGAPDLYHYGNDNNPNAGLLSPVGFWDIMSNCALGDLIHPGAYMKFKYGKWISAIPEIKAEGTYSLSPLVSSSNSCYKIASPNSQNQFFILEYRKMEGFDNLTGNGDKQGLLVYRIDTTNGLIGNAWGPPDEIYVYRPDGTTTYTGIDWKANFSKDVGRTAINNSTNPSCFLQDGTPGGLNILNIGNVDSTIRFEVSFQFVASIKLTSPLQCTNLEVGQSVPIIWTSDGVTKFKLEYSLDAGLTWNTIVSSIEQNNYDWIVPDTPSARCVLRISDSFNSATISEIRFYISDSSDFYPLVTGFSMSPIYQCDQYFGGTFVENEFWVHNPVTLKIYRVDRNGSLIGEFTTPWLTSLSYDGSKYVYAVKYYGEPGGKIYKIDSSTKTIVDSLSGTTEMFIWGCAYDPTADDNKGGLWVVYPSLDVFLISLDGRKLKTISSTILNLPRIIGIAFDNYSPGGPYLWFLDEGKGWGYPQIIYKFNIASNTFTSKFHDVSKDFGMNEYQRGAGLSITDKFAENKISLCGVYTTYMESKIFVYEVGDVTVGMDNEDAIPTTFSLSQNYPNPFNPTTKIKFAIPAVGNGLSSFRNNLAVIKVFDVLGREITTLVNEYKPAGTYEVEFDGSALSSGIYFYQLKSDSYILTKKMNLIK